MPRTPPKKHTLHSQPASFFPVELTALDGVPDKKISMKPVPDLFLQSILECPDCHMWKQQKSCRSAAARGTFSRLQSGSPQRQPLCEGSLALADTWIRNILPLIGHCIQARRIGDSKRPRMPTLSSFLLELLFELLKGERARYIFGRGSRGPIPVARRAPSIWDSAGTGPGGHLDGTPGASSNPCSSLLIVVDSDGGTEVMQPQVPDVGELP